MDAVIFDLFGVLMRLPARRDRRRLRALAGISDPGFGRSYWRNRPGYDRGELDAAAYWQLVGEPAGRRYDAGQVRALVQADTAMWARPNAPMVGTLLALRAAGVRTAILSNVPADIWRRLARQHAWLHSPDATMLSFRAGAAKPEPAIYRQCLDGLGVIAARALFVDDRPENVAAARALGLQARRLTWYGQPLTVAYLRRCARHGPGC